MGIGDDENIKFATRVYSGRMIIKNSQNVIYNL